MPKRKSRPDLMRSLLGKWKDFYAGRSYLRSVAIGDGAPLRGIKNSKLVLPFPVTVVCGPNGTGKTTFLALALLAFHAEAQPLSISKKSKYYEFKDFFVPVTRDPQPAGICVEWEYTDNAQDRIKKGKQRWLRYIRNSGKPRRPLRGTEFVGISRITPAFEKKNFGSYFSRRRGINESDASDILSYLSRVLKKPYESLKELEYKNTSGSFKSRYYNGTHTSFNAGAGEECLFAIFRALINSPEGSFVAIEEIEIGLHPSTLRELLDCILEIADNRKLQVLITSHSPDFLRACPKDILVLAERQAGSVIFSHEPNVEYAISRLGGDVKKSLHIICEDECAKQLIECSLPSRLRTLAPVVGFGGKEQLLEKARTISKASNDAKIMIVWDGEVSDKLVAMANKDGFLGLRLPGFCEPEQFILKSLSRPDGRQFLEDEYGLNGAEIEDLLNASKALQDVHDIPFTICERLGISLGEFNAIIKHVAIQEKSDLSFLSETVARVANMNIQEYVAYVSEVAHQEELA